ncbi:MAG: TATA-box-binding protein [Thaumarchaeota archaeon]|jgi:transcription initiation factor TFIID TATA-box-binding protein|nr:TATA-box-binding protein [Candidatus Geocrenenecus arthurdayi]MCL7389671.1 TATA-box-binding protein [Candidatus Geocrenenecus arthurdayi]MCL7391233.1 TATA-box-binding protein [Candidatus Geocrenenecus arthurdayi]MCL7396541.1 TATA-box-binding protein [Candidatus Geocrenenecus arthurdayi]MCL7403772.1 TATA-box-binding protein [Candidatus Geocrenenecus arthurdayi]
MSSHSKAPEPSIEIQNVVASVTINQRLDLAQIQKTFPDVEYKPAQFPGLVFRLQKPKTATLIFSSGKMVCTGAKSEQESIKAVQTVIKLLKKEGFLIQQEPQIEIQNIVASIDLHGTINLEQAANKLENTMYEPEQFPGLIFRMMEPKVVILMFASGKLVCTGAKTEKEVHDAVYKLKLILEENNLITYPSTKS